MINKLFVVAISFYCSVVVNAQVKKYVGVVRQKYYLAHESFLKDLSDSLSKKGYRSYSEYVDNYLKGGFGSGFVYVGKDGTNYVVTNRHVVSQAESASIEFENEDGSISKYENLSVLITDDDIDLAILIFKGDEKPFKKGLNFYSGKLYDGQVVASAGFPGLGKDPVWQFGKGSVTNAKARIKELIDPSISTVIQHSAQIDAGNSGGPLLVESKSSETGYEVAGINTWKAVGRDATNFSIPATLALRLIENSKKSSSDSTLKSDRLEKFKKALIESSNDYTSIVKFVGYNFASEQGEDYFEEILRYGSTNVRNRVLNEFSYNPIEGLRYAVAYNIFNEYSGENATDEKLSELIWAKEHGLYRISSADSKNKDKKTKKPEKKSSSENTSFSISFEGLKNPYYLALYAGSIISLENNVCDKEMKGGLDFSADLFLGDAGIWGLFFEYTGTTLEGEKFNAIGGGGEVRIPFDFSLFSFCPNVRVGMQLNTDEPKVSRFFWEVGAEAVFDVGFEYFKPCISAAYRKNYDKYTDFSTSAVEEEINSSNIAIKIGIAFSFD